MGDYYLIYSKNNNNPSNLGISDTFADIACTRSFLPKEYFMPYGDYVYTVTKDGDTIVDPNYYAPELLIKSSLWKVFLTIGFRF